ncbi:MAG: hypothetical protein AAF378_14945 [Cyanobacteria bacterium P01_A01_bin.84]
MNNYHEALKAITSATIEPRQFLRHCFGIDKLPSEEALEEETSFGYCSKSVRLLSKILGFQRKTVREWGQNPNFEGMPQHARITCNYALIALSKQEINTIICSDSQAPTTTAKEFIEAIFLKDLSASDREKAVSSTQFRSQCFALISKTLKVSKSTIYQWGSDVELSRMPKHYEHTLAYALAAYRKQERIAA